MSQHLPLVAAQPGIWMAEKLSDLPSAWSVAHYVELTGEVDAPLLARAVVAGLAQADTLRMRFTEDNGEVWQWVDDALTFELPEIIDLRTNIDPHGTAQALMQADLQQDLRVDSGKPLVFHQLIQLAGIGVIFGLDAALLPGIEGLGEVIGADLRRARGGGIRRGSRCFCGRSRRGFGRRGGGRCGFGCGGGRRGRGLGCGLRH